MATLSCIFDSWSSLFHFGVALLGKPSLHRMLYLILLQYDVSIKHACTYAKVESRQLVDISCLLILISFRETIIPVAQPAVVYTCGTTSGGRIFLSIMHVGTKAGVSYTRFYMSKLFDKIM